MLWFRWVLVRWILVVCCWMPSQALATFNGIDAADIRQHAKTITTELAAKAPSDLSALDYYKLTLAYDELSNKDGALAAANQGLLKVEDVRLQYELTMARASVYGRLFRDTRKAIEDLNQAEQLLNSLTTAEINDVRARLYETFAQAYNQLGNLDDAARYGQLAVDDAVRQNLPKQEVRSRLILGRIVLQQNNYAEAQRQLSRALELAKTTNQQAQIGSIALRLGMAYQKLEQYDNAINHFLQSRDYYGSQKVSSQQVTIALHLANCYLATGNLAAAAQEIDKAHSLTTQLQSDPLLMAQVLYLQGSLASHQHQNNRAEELLVKSLQLYQQQGQLTMSAEVTMNLVEHLLSTNELVKANTYLAQQEKPEQLPLYLQQQWFDSLAKLRAREQQWQAAYEAQYKAAELRFRWVKQQENFKLAGLQAQLPREAKPKTTETSAGSQWSLILNIGLSLALLLVTLNSTQLWRKRRHDQGKTPSRFHLLSWATFAKKLTREQQREPHILMAVQLEQVSQRKHQFGERRLRALWQDLLANLPADYQQRYTIHTDTFWLYVPVSQFDGLVEPLQQTLHRLALGLPESCGIHVFSAELQPLMGANWPAEALMGLRELVWSSWQHLTKPRRIQHIHATSPTLTPVSWLAENVRLDIDNAIQLGLLRLELLRDEPVELTRQLDRDDRLPL